MKQIQEKNQKTQPAKNDAGTEQNELRELLPVSQALQTLYCPRNFYYRFVAGITVQNARMMRGTLEDQRRMKKKIVHRSRSVQMRDAALSSYELGLTGNVDAVEETDDGPVPLEYKTGDVTDNVYDRAQLCAYGMMLEEMRNIRINYGFLYYTGSRKRVRIDFNEELRNKVLAAVERAWKILEGGEIPQPLDDERCRGCALAEICMPDEVTRLEKGTDIVDAGVAPRCTFERTVFMDEGWGSLGKTGNTLSIKKGDEKIGAVPFEYFDQVFIFGKVNLSGAVLREFFRRNIFVAFFTAFGSFEGSLSPERSRYAALRKAQWAAADDPQKKLVIAREIVDAKLANMRVMLQRAGRRNDSENIRKYIKNIAGLRKNVAKCSDLGSLMGIEGAASRTYFKGLRMRFHQKWKFAARTRRPPKDPVNSVLSFGYSVLAGQLTGLIQAVGLDPYIGFLHSEKYGRPCLALDLMEPFRPVIADSTALRMFSNNMVDDNCFDLKKNISNACLLNEKGRKSFFRAFSNRMDETATHPVFGYKLNYRRILEMEVRFLAKFLVGEINRFQAYRIR